MINTIQFNNKEYHRIAIKRDAAAVAQTQYGFFYLHWNVLIDGTTYLFANPATNITSVYNLIGTNMTIPAAAITNFAYEGMEVPVNMPDSALQTVGTLHSNSEYFNYGCSKSTVELTPSCSLKYPSADYDKDRLVREEDIVKPDAVKLYFDKNHINVECFAKFDPSIVSGTYAGYITRFVGDDLNVTVLRSRNSLSYITCHIGDTIKIISTKTPLQNVKIRSYSELDDLYAHIGPLDENGDVITINLQVDGTYDYTITLDCFITFDIAAANYTLYGAILEDTEYCDRCAVQVNNTDFIIAGSTELAKRVILENSKVDLNIELSVYTIDAYTKKRDFAFAGDPEYVLVDINNNVIYDTNGSEVYVYTEYNGDSLLTNSQLLIILSDSTSLPLAVQGWYNLIEVINLTTNTKETVTITSGGSHSSTSSAYFTMPSADCLLTVSTKIVTDGDTVTISPLYSLTIDVDENSSSVFPISVTTGNTTTEYNSSTTIQNIENNYFSATWNEVDGKLYHILYKTDYTIFDDYATKAASYSNSLMGNRTLSIRLIDPDVIYRNTTKISTIAAEEKYEENNIIISDSNVVMALNDYPRRTYYANTESSIKTSGNHFTNLQSLKKVIFNNVDSTFTVNEDAFNECNKLESVSINGTENIKVKDRAFYNNIMLSEFNDLNKITELGHSCFYGSALYEYKSNVKLKNIPELAFSKSSLSTVNLAGTPIDPAELTSIDNSAFSNCYKLNTVHLPYALIKLGQNVFENTALPCVHTTPAYADEKVLSPYGAVFNVYDDYTNLLTILPKNTFKGCTNLVEAHLPTSINLIKTGAFRECDNLKYFTAPGLKMLELGVFYGTWIEEKHRYNDLESAGNDGIRKKNNTTGIYFEFPFWNTRPNDHYVFIKPDDSKSDCILYKRLFPVRASDYKITPDNGNFTVVGIADYGFSHKDNLDLIGVNGYTFEALLVTTVGKYAFKDANVRYVTLSSNLSYLGEGAFYNCEHLSRVYGMLNWQINEIPNKAFYNCGGVLYGIGSVFDTSGLLADPEFYLPLTTKRIGDFAFYNCKLMMRINNLALCEIEEIGESAFENCFLNQSWRLLNGIRIAVKVIGITLSVIGAFFGYVGVGISIPGHWTFGDDVAKLLKWGIEYTTKKYIGQGIGIAVGGAAAAALGTTAAVHVDYFNNGLTEENAKNLTVELLFPKVTKIGLNAFRCCTHLESITVNNKITEIPKGAFYGCEKLVHFGVVDDSFDVFSETEQSLATPKIKNIGDKAFYGTSIYTNDVVVNMLLFNAEYIGAFAFSTNCDEVLIDKSIILPNNVKSIGRSALDPFISVICPILDFSDKNFVCPFESSRDPRLYHPIVTIPEGAKNSAQSINWGNELIEFTEVPQDDPLWKVLKISGYDIPWEIDVELE